MAALLHPETLSLFSLDLDPESELPGAGLLGSTSGDSAAVAATAPWNDPAFLVTSAHHGPDASIALRTERPQFRLIIGGLDPAVAPRRMLRPTARTVLGGLALAVLVAFASIGALNLLGADAAATVPASPAAINHPAGADATTTPSAPVEVVVHPGDTIWSIARRLRPSGEIRGVVDALQRRVGGSELEVGQRIDLSGLIRG